MQILTNHQVEYCNLETKIAGNIECLPGVSFQDKLFIKKKFFAPEAKAQAIEYCKQKYLAAKGSKAYILIDDITGLTVWIEDKSAIIAGDKDPLEIIKNIDLEDLVSKMRSVGGIKIKDRQYHLKSYKQCFVGNEACEYLMERLSLSVEQAISLGQRLIDEHWIHHVSDRHSFKNEALFYRFYWDEE